MDIGHKAISALRRIGIVALIALAFIFGLSATVYLSLRSSEVKVPEVVGKDRFEAERILAKADLNFRVRATRPSNQVNADTVLFQLPRAGEVVKVGQTVAMDISRSAKAGEAPEAAVPDDKDGNEVTRGNLNANASTAIKNDNENRPKKNKNTNKNANDAATANTNANANAGNRVNANRAATNVNSGNTRPREVGNTNANSGRPASQNENRRQPAARPSPTAQKNNR